jgi:HD-GYP domain-containing protein (c-di-GMP phosphodiesterase class II)
MSRRRSFVDAAAKTNEERDTALTRTSNKTTSVHYLPHAVAVTAMVMLLPVLLAAPAIELAGVPHGFLTHAVATAVLSVGITKGAGYLWRLLPASNDIDFPELMLWVLLREARIEKKLEGGRRLLGLDQDGNRTHELTIPPERQLQVLKELNAALESKDLYTLGHTRRVARVAYWIARNMKLDRSLIEHITLAADIHDVGKVAVADAVLRKPGKLTDDEYELMKTHSTVGAEMVSQLGSPSLTSIVRYHHERWDGKGYPHGVSGVHIPLGARIIAVADTYDAITSTRSYRSRSSHKKAVGIVRDAAGTQFDPEVVKAFLATSRAKSSAWNVFLVFATLPQRVVAWSSSWGSEAAGNFARSAATAGSAAVMSASLVAGGIYSVPGPAAANTFRPPLVLAAAPQSVAFVAGGTVPAPERAAEPVLAPTADAPGTDDAAVTPAERPASTTSSEAPTEPAGPAGDNGASSTERPRKDVVDHSPEEPPAEEPPAEEPPAEEPPAEEPPAEEPPAEEPPAEEDCDRSGTGHGDCEEDPADDSGICVLIICIGGRSEGLSPAAALGKASPRRSSGPTARQPEVAVTRS